MCDNDVQYGTHITIIVISNTNTFPVLQTFAGYHHKKRRSSAYSTTTKPGSRFYPLQLVHYCCIIVVIASSLVSRAMQLLT